MQIGLTGILGIIFIVLKLTHEIAWSWIWVLSPFWIGFLLWAIFAIIFITIFKRAEKNMFEPHKNRFR